MNPFQDLRLASNLEVISKGYRIVGLDLTVRREVIWKNIAFSNVKGSDL